MKIDFIAVDEIFILPSNVDEGNARAQFGQMRRIENIFKRGQRPTGSVGFRDAITFVTKSQRKVTPLLLLLLALPVTVSAQFTCITNGFGTITITAYTDTNAVATIPNTINGLPVTAIGDKAFYNQSSLTSVTIPSSVTSIGTSAFYFCLKLAAFSIPNSVTNIGSGAFYVCNSLTNVTIPDGVTSIQNDTFLGCQGLTNVSSIGGRAFSSCTSLLTVTIPNSVTNIGDGAFISCLSLTAITVDALNPAFTSVAGILFNLNQTTLIQCPGGKVGDYTIPNTVTNIGYGAFDDCNLLTGVAIPNSVAIIEGLAFASCSFLTNLTLPNSVISIGDRAFAYCNNLASVTLPDSLTSIEIGVFHFCTSLTSITIPDSVTNIANNAFSACFSLSSIVLPGSVTSIENYAFTECFNLTSVYFNGSAPDVGSSVFSSDSIATVYYLPGATGWESTFAGRPTKVWNPEIQTNEATFGVRTNQFGFNISWADGRSLSSKPPRIWPIRFGLPWEPTPSPAAGPISAIYIGRIIPPDSIASVGRNHVHGQPERN